MNFSVEPGNIEGFAKLIDRAAGDTHAARSYMLKNSTIDDSIGDIWQRAFGPHQERLAEAERLLREFERILDDSSIQLRRTAEHYRETDRAVVAHMDATSPGTDGWRNYVAYSEVDTTDFADAVDPTTHLKVPGGASGYIQGHISEFEFAPMHKSLGTIMDLGSASALAAEGIKAVFGFDIFGTVTKWITGDWDSYANCADVWDNLGKFCADLSSNISSGNNTLDRSWSGNAADSAWLYFNTLAENLESSQESFNSLRDKYEATALSVFSFAELVKGGIADICDAAIAFAIVSAASAAAASTGVGAIASVAGVAVAIERAHSMVMQYGRLVAQFDAVMLALNTIWGTGTGAMAKMDYQIKDFPSPGKTYNSPPA